MSSARAELAKALATRYVIERELGSGAAAFVYCAHDRKHDRKVAIKVLRPELASLLGPERFLNEVRITARLNHPNIVPLYDSGEAAGLPYYVMPVIEGESLRDRLDRDRQLSVSEAVSIVRAVASAITYAHDHDVVHRDIKPENILMHQGVPMIADFGIAAVIQKIGGTRLTVTGISLGTPAYMSPEQARGEQPGRASDVYSLASLLYEMLAGDPPFTGNSVQAILTKLQHEKPTPLRLLRENLPRGIDAAVERALAKVKADRYATAAEFTAALVAASAEPVAPPDVMAAAPVPRPTDPPAFHFPFLAELKQRRVFRVALAYGGIGFVILQGAPPIVNALGLPAEVDRLIAILVLVGFPIALAFSWAFELTLEGALRLEGRPRRQVRDRLALSWRWGIGAAVGATAMAGAIWWTQPVVGKFLDRGSLDPMRYVILPLADSAAAVREDDLLGDAFARWSGIEVVLPYRAREQLDAPLAGAGDEQHVARSLQAGRYVRLEAATVGMDRRVVAALHDTESGDRLAEESMLHAGFGTPSDSLFAALAAVLLFRAAGFPDADHDDVRGTFNYPAALAFLRGHEALRNWDLDAAAAGFDLSLQQDPDFTRAALWTAQIRNWEGVVASASDMAPLIARAASAPQQLHAHEARLLTGLRHLSREEFTDACAVYSAIVGTEEADFAGLYGLGECHVRDRRVIPDSASPSHWSFRSSYHRGVVAFYRAFRILPAGRSGFNTRTVERVQHVLFTTTTRRRGGFWQRRGDEEFTAHASWEADTLAFIPYPTHEGGMGQPGIPSTTGEAVKQHRIMFNEITNAWAMAFPRSAHAREALAVAQEVDSPPQALRTLREARSITDDPSLRAFIAVREILLLVKVGIPDDTLALRRARAVGDSLLQRSAADETPAPAHVAAVAALLGRRARAATLTHAALSAAAGGADSQASLDAYAAVLLVWAALGGPADSVRAYERQLESAIRNRLPREDQEGAINSYFALPVILGSPHGLLHGPLALMRNSPHPSLRVQATLVAGDSAAARDSLLHVEDVRRLTRPAERTMDALFAEASLWTALGDTSTAIGMLDRTLNELQWSEPNSLASVELVGALMWAMTLRADLAAATGDPTAAARWAAPVAILWARADRDLLHVSARMRLLLSGQSSH